ncbi:hypothetical protein [Phycisphaera mikurensis]|uniref:Uncharacterized protein n=1 Tax=Phycisphaera mikurensis (strain NBRC 102666 / KCTC 22515 / FYK2301M01) TaxID=1142394 RepID=I0IH17_PHYMF|nr:hypothetical protein [Phycisphaera mikurensis]MBB6440810.1 hypothetical protein [Phycisphaera mikurensis]BAM04555.1 hypothetical protein PSMK_23960 [Phycisphaera mikurensis NBRC 102666]
MPPPAVPRLLVLVAAAAGSGCVTATPATPAPGDAGAGPAVLPGTPAPRAGAWYASRLDGGRGVFAGHEGPVLATRTTRTRGGLRVGADGRVRDTLSTSTRGESVVQGVR